jgi:hypothetical protein
LIPVKWDDLLDEQKAKEVRVQMFLKEKFDDGVFTKLKACLVADGHTQDRNLYSDYSWPTTKS